MIWCLCAMGLPCCNPRLIELIIVYGGSSQVASEKREREEKHYDTHAVGVVGAVKSEEAI